MAWELKQTDMKGLQKLDMCFLKKDTKVSACNYPAFDHQQDSYFGLTTYNAEQSNFYSNLIYQSIIGNTAHKFRTGISFSADKYNELYQNADHSKEMK